MAEVELKDVAKMWESSVAVERMNLRLEDGEFAAILGPSGCGKSTTLFMLAGIYAPTRGDILFDGAKVNEVEARNRNVGIVFQSYALYPNMSVLQNILFPLRFKKTDKKDANKQAREIAELVQIEELLSRRPAQLSGGQQQRVALARALIKKPHLLLLDEPLSNLDATLRLSMRVEIRRIQRELGVTTILVTHDQIEATTMSDRIICMNTGRIEQVGTAEELYLAPHTRFVASFIGSPPINLLQGQRRCDRLQINGATLDLVAGETSDNIVLGVRPEHIEASDAGLPATVAATEPMGRETLYTAATSLGPLRFLEATSAPRFKTGEAIKLRFSAQQTMLFDEATNLRLNDAHAALT